MLSDEARAWNLLTEHIFFFVFVNIYGKLLRSSVRKVWLVIYCREVDLKKKIVHISFTTVWIINMGTRLIDQSFLLHGNHIAHINTNFKAWQLVGKFSILGTVCGRFKKYLRLADLEFSFDFTKFCAIINAELLHDCCQIRENLHAHCKCSTIVEHTLILHRRTLEELTWRMISCTCKKIVFKGAVLVRIGIHIFVKHRHSKQGTLRPTTSFAFLLTAQSSNILHIFHNCNLMLFFLQSLFLLALYFFVLHSVFITTYLSVSILLIINSYLCALFKNPLITSFPWWVPDSLFHLT